MTADADDQQTLREVVSFYHQTLQESPEALRYLESRGLRNPDPYNVLTNSQWSSLSVHRLRSDMGERFEVWTGPR